MISNTSITREPLQLLRVDAIAYGAKDTGEMGGGAAAAILSAAGPDVLPALEGKLAGTQRRVGEVVVTEAFGLAELGVRYVFHIVSIIKNTPEGAYCPESTLQRTGSSILS